MHTVTPHDPHADEYFTNSNRAIEYASFGARHLTTVVHRWNSRWRHDLRSLQCR